MTSLLHGPSISSRPSRVLQHLDYEIARVPPRAVAAGPQTRDEAGRGSVVRAGEASEAVRQAALVKRVVVLPALVGRLEVVHAAEGVVLAGREVLPDELSAVKKKSDKMNRHKKTKRNETEHRGRKEGRGLQSGEGSSRNRERERERELGGKFVASPTIEGPALPRAFAACV